MSRLVSGHPAVYREDEVIEALWAAASAGGANPARIKKRHSVMNDVTGKYCLGGFYPTLDTSEFGDVEVIDDTPDRESLDTLLDGQMPLVDDSSAKYFITISRMTAFRSFAHAGLLL